MAITTPTVEVILAGGGQTTVASTNAETTLVSHDIPAAILGTAGSFVRLKAEGFLTNGSGSGCTYTFKIKIGANIIYQDVTASIASGGGTFAFDIDVKLVSLGSNTLNSLVGYVSIGSRGGATVGTGDIGIATTQVGQTIGNPSANQNVGVSVPFVVTVQMSQNNAAAITRKDYSYLSYLTPPTTY